jgi:hypothetical protein
VLTGAVEPPLHEYVVTGYLNRRGAEGPECILEERTRGN